MSERFNPPANSSPAVLFLSFAAIPSKAIVAGQREAGQRRAADLHLRIVHEILETGSAALSFEKRPSFVALLNYFDSHPHVHHVILPGRHRVSRNVVDFHAIEQRFKQLGVEIVVITGDQSGRSLTALAKLSIKQRTMRRTPHQGHRNPKQDRKSDRGGAA